MGFNFLFRVSVFLSLGFWVLGFGFRVLGFEFRVLGFGFWVSGFSLVLGLGLGAWAYG